MHGNNKCTYLDGLVRKVCSVQIRSVSSVGSRTLYQSMYVCMSTEIHTMEVKPRLKAEDMKSDTVFTAQSFYQWQYSDNRASCRYYGTPCPREGATPVHMCFSDPSWGALFWAWCSTKALRGAHDSTICSLRSGNKHGPFTSGIMSIRH